MLLEYLLQPAFQYKNTSNKAFEIEMNILVKLMSLRTTKTIRYTNYSLILACRERSRAPTILFERDLAEEMLPVRRRVVGSSNATPPM